MQNLSNITSIILAGGFGARLRTVVSDRPKVLAEVQGRPFLRYLLDQLSAAGVNDVVLCTGYLGDQVRAAFGSSYGGLQLSYSHETSPLGTAGAVRKALPLMKSDSALVMNGDSYCSSNLKEFYAYHYATKAQASLLLTWVADTSRYGRVQVDDDGFVLAFEEKSNHREPGWINAGIYLLNRRLIRAIQPNAAVSIERDVFPVWVGCGLRAYRSQGCFLDIGTPESYAAGERFFLNIL